MLRIRLPSFTPVSLEVSGMAPNLGEIRRLVSMGLKRSILVLETKDVAFTRF